MPISRIGQSAHTFVLQSEFVRDFVNSKTIAFWHKKANQIMDNRHKPKVGLCAIPVFENDTEKFYSVMINWFF